MKSKVTELDDYRPVALTSVIMKCFERLVKDHITSTLPDTLDFMRTGNLVALLKHVDTADWDRE